jgi:hypothetical protein
MFSDETRTKDVGERVVKANMDFYGGLALSVEDIKLFKTFYFSLKEKFKIPFEVELKWHSKDVFSSFNSSKISPINKEWLNFQQSYNKLKEEILEFISCSQSTIIIVFRPTDLLVMDSRKSVEWCLYDTCNLFDRFLKEKESKGLLLADNLESRLEGFDSFNLSLHKYGIKKFNNTLDNISYLILTTNSKHSPIHQLVDIVLGAVSYYFYQYLRAIDLKVVDRSISISSLTKLLTKFYCGPSGNILNWGLCPKPSSFKRTESWTSWVLDSIEENLRLNLKIN